jgi:hypothetical protein
MPLHDWGELSGWDGVHQVWMVELLYSLKAKLPLAYRAYIGTTPTFAIGAADDGRTWAGRVGRRATRDRKAAVGMRAWNPTTKWPWRPSTPTRR